MNPTRIALFLALPMIAGALAGCESESARPIVLRPPVRVAHQPARQAAPKPVEHAQEPAPAPAPAAQARAQPAGANTTCAAEIERAKMCTAGSQEMSNPEKEELFRRFDDYLANQRERQ